MGTVIQQDVLDIGTQDHRDLHGNSHRALAGDRSAHCASERL